LKPNLHAGKKPKVGLDFQVFTEDELNDIHLATLEVLEHTGLFFDDEEALEVLDGGGAVIDKKNRVARFPANVVEDAIGSAPRPQSPARLPNGQKPGGVYQFWRRCVHQ
jgi:trimethylamine--corrinoid protein Co-methyltransferase